MKQYCVYIMTNKKFGVLYVGVTSDLLRRIHEHQQKTLDGFTKSCNLHQLVYYEIHEDPESAIRREKQIKRWKREWKLRLIAEMNSEWNDLSEQVA